MSVLEDKVIENIAYSLVPDDPEKIRALGVSDVTDISIPEVYYGLKKLELKKFVSRFAEGHLYDDPNQPELYHYRRTALERPVTETVARANLFQKGMIVAGILFRVAASLPDEYVVIQSTGSMLLAAGTYAIPCHKWDNRPCWRYFRGHDAMNANTVLAQGITRQQAEALGASVF